MSKFGPLAALHVNWADSVKGDPPYAIYFFKEKEYVRWNVDEECLFDGYPKPIEEGWPGLLGQFPGIPLSGSMHVPGWQNKVYFFFKGQDRLASWDVESNTLDPEPRAISDVMPGELAADGHFTPLYVDDGENQKVYGFRGDTYARWTVVKGELPTSQDEGYPRKIGDGWTGGLTVSPSCAVNVNWTRRSKALTNRKVYFFLGDLYTRWDVDSHSNNYRLDVPSGWKGWPDFE